MAHRVVLVRGDGVGPEVVEAARRAVDATGVEIDWELRPAGQDGPVASGLAVAAGDGRGDSRRRSRPEGADHFGWPGPGPASANHELRRKFDLQLSVRPARSMFGAAGVRPGIDLVWRV